LGKKPHPHCLSHPAVQLATYRALCYQGTAEKHAAPVADVHVVIPVEKYI